MKSSTRNEWDPLKKVIVGIADDAKIPLLDPSLRLINYAHEKHTYKIPNGPYPTQVIDEANEDLETLCKFLTGEGVEVFRPNKEYVPKYYNYCPRDTILTYDKYAIATPMSLMNRRDEWQAYSDIFSSMTVMGLPQDNDSLYNINCLGNPDILALNDTEPCFDAANVLKANDDLYYLISNTGNKKGAEKLQELFPQSKVHTIEGVYSYIHIDSTIALLREGLMLLNPSRVKSVEQLPMPLRNWDVIWAPEPVDIGHYPGYCNASTWVSVNLLSVNPNLVVLEEHQHNLRVELEKYNIESAMLPMRHARTLGGCFHCVTVDIERTH
jgi:N-dimethylarginine dimethylaminohydrolase